mmetsp:Transcript_82500/g.267143  ORF Transcript_82500/g.267143 Transcript_82500/m.267143 type:complete len:129 (-) Transcript_82500:13-399(-)
MALAAQLGAASRRARDQMHPEWDETVEGLLEEFRRECLDCAQYGQSRANFELASFTSKDSWMRATDDDGTCKLVYVVGKLNEAICAEMGIPCSRQPPVTITCSNPGGCIRVFVRWSVPEKATAAKAAA